MSVWARMISMCGLSIEEAAKLCGLSVSSSKKRHSGLVPPRAEDVRRLAVHYTILQSGALAGKSKGADEALEAYHLLTGKKRLVPFRRGRTPGSKNRPKVAPTPTEPTQPLEPPTTT